MKKKGQPMQRQVAWETRPLSVVTSANSTTVTFRLRNGKTRDQGTKLPHTFSVGNGIVVTNRIPTDVIVSQGEIQGRWVVYRMRWKALPQMVQRQSYDTLLVTFEPEEGGTTGFARTTEVLANVPHTFTVDGITTVDQKPSKVLTVRGGHLCPCYGVWIVSKPLSQPQWGTQPTTMPWRKWNDRDRIISEYEFFFPSNSSGTDWETIAKATTHSFKVAGVEVSQVPDQVYTVRSGRVLGRWLVHVPLLEGFDANGECTSSFSQTMYWITFTIIIVLAILVIVYLARRMCQDTAVMVMVRTPTIADYLPLNSR
jgi:hypothetical protein